jgi:hypothetical protein
MPYVFGQLLEAFFYPARCASERYSVAELLLERHQERRRRPRQCVVAAKMITRL